jgi:hypothetical protein
MRDGPAIRQRQSFRRLHLAGVHRREGLGQKGVEKAAAGGAGMGEARLQPVAKRHQLIDLGYDAVLFGEGWEGKLVSVLEHEPF